MSVLVVGASGATGRLLVENLLNHGVAVKAVVRSAERLPESVLSNPLLTVIEGSVLDFNDTQLADLVNGCSAIASCLGHNLTFRGMYGAPRKLVTDSVKRLCEAVKVNQPEQAVRFVLMNTSGNRNRDLNEPISFGERLVVGLIRALVPPHPDNEQAADYLRTQIGSKDEAVEWVAVRPDSLINEDAVSEYEIHPSPTRSAIFDPGKTSRINVADFMARLATEESLWQQWKGQMPVIYNQGFA
ncbi:NAD(P)-dependent oxidoreductase [Thiomicrospira pelophila]|uniref:NAD(P)-dependent oxidoreductase n=1 Tax=Thiomicrospira pelophila TaxID=934 RepID=UPI0004A6BC18|nr:NAD(P)-binding oxidoreductase [Thiomicrospira pelophila]